jgi:hypothetical protein
MSSRRATTPNIEPGGIPSSTGQTEDMSDLDPRRFSDQMTSRDHKLLEDGEMIAERAKSAEIERMDARSLRSHSPTALPSWTAPYEGGDDAGEEGHFLSSRSTPGVIDKLGSLESIERPDRDFEMGEATSESEGKCDKH